MIRRYRVVKGAQQATGEQKTGLATKDANGNGTKGRGGHGSAKTRITVPASYPAASRSLSTRSAHGGNGVKPKTTSGSRTSGNGARSAAEREALLKQQQEYLRNREAEMKVLAEQISEIHNGIVNRFISSTRRSYEEAIKAGEKLIKAKELVGHSSWLKWIHKNLPFSEDTAENYMRAYRHKDEPEFRNVRNLSEAYQKIRLIVAKPKKPKEIKQKRDTAPERDPDEQTAFEKDLLMAIKVLSEKLELSKQYDYLKNKDGISTALRGVLVPGIKGFWTHFGLPAEELGN